MLLRVFLLLLCLANLAAAQDRVTLKSGDVLTGKIVAMADEKLTIENKALGKLVVPMDEVDNLSTGETVRLLTKQGEELRRRIAGIEDGELKMGSGGDGAPDILSISLANLEQINPPPTPPVKWTGSFKLAGNLMSGNTERRSSGLSFQAERRSKIDRITAYGSWDYADERSTPGPWNLTQRRAGMGLQYDYFLDQRWYSLATTSALGDTLADIELRYTVGAGFGHQVLDSPERTLLVELGLSYVNESYRSDIPGIDYIGMRVAYKLVHHFSDKTRLLHGIEAYPSLQTNNDFYLQAATELQTNMTESMIGSLSWVIDYDNTPAPGLDRTDSRIVLAVGWAF